MQNIVDSIYQEMCSRTARGKVANYIPQLACVDPSQFALTVVTQKGDIYGAGCADTLFSIQSISKVFTLTIALGKLGDNLWARVGREPSGDPFNSIVQLDHRKVDQSHRKVDESWKKYEKKCSDLGPEKKSN